MPDAKRFRDYGSEANGAMADLRAVLLQFVEDHADRLGRTFLPEGPVFKTVLGPPEDHVLRLTHYPANSGCLVNHAHTDIDIVTVLPPATTLGLEIEFDGRWTPVPIGLDEVAVLAGDFTEMLGGRAAARHRVVATGVERFSASLFVNADPNLVIRGRAARSIFQERIAAVSGPTPRD